MKPNLTQTRARAAEAKAGAHGFVYLPRFQFWPGGHRLRFTARRAGSRWHPFAGEASDSASTTKVPKTCQKCRGRERELICKLQIKFLAKMSHSNSARSKEVLRNVPVVDISNFEERKHAIAQELHQAAKHTGFFYIKVKRQTFFLVTSRSWPAQLSHAFAQSARLQTRGAVPAGRSSTLT